MNCELIEINFTFVFCWVVIGALACCIFLDILFNLDENTILEHP